jgi:hypothetical protein
MLTSILQALSNLAAWIIGFLPESPFNAIEYYVLTSDVLSWMAWFIPWGPIVALLNAWVAGYFVFLGVKKLLSFTGLIS